MQTVIGRRGNCLAACLASLLERDLASVPAFSDYVGWWAEARTWTRQAAGYDLLAVAPSEPEEPLSRQSWTPAGYAVLACVPLHPLAEPEAVYTMPLHAVVVCDGRVVHDPQPRLWPVEDPVAVMWYVFLPTKATFEACQELSSCR